MKSIKFSLLFCLFLLNNVNSVAQEICRDTNCEIFKDAIEYKDLPKNYSGYCISRFDKKFIFSAKDSLSIVKSKVDTTIRRASDILKPFKVDEEKNYFRKGQITQIVLMANGKEVVAYSFYDNGKVSMISYSNREHKKFIIYAMNYVYPLIQYYKNGNIKSLVSYNLLNEKTSVNSYYPDQTLRLKATTKKWKYEGTVITYYPNGKVYKIAMTHEDLLEGFLLTYDEYDKLIKTEFYKENVLFNPLDLRRYDAQLLILKTLAEEENRNIDRKNELLEATKALIEKEVLKKQKEEELKVQEAEIAKQKLELELLSKNKAISDFALREKQNEIAQAELFAKQKRQEIENLSKENLINELNLKNKEAELQKNSIEAKIDAMSIKNLNSENAKRKSEALKKQEEIEKQTFIRNIFIGGFSLLILLVFLVLRSLQQNKKANKIILAQKQEVESAHNHLEEKNREILDSITYAKRIQSAILPQPRLVKEYFKDSFILYKPKDIVAGDFYWFEVIDDLIFFAAADCTGHGVPGAMVSVVCHNALNRSVKEFNLKNPAEILDKTREIVISEFEKSEEEVKDGMDISLCVINLETNVLNWSGAHNPLWILRKNANAVNELVEYKADKQPIGKFAHAKAFTKHEIELQKDDEIYIFTDGFQDQFGGDREKKYKVSQLRELLLDLNHSTMEEKRTQIDLSFETWKGNLEQVDDVCVIGVRV